MSWIKNKLFPVLKYLKYLGIIIILIMMIEAWERHITASIHKAIPPEAIKSEQELWSALCALTQDSQEYYEQSEEIYKEGDKKRPKADAEHSVSEDEIYDEKHTPRVLTPPRRFDLGKLRQNAKKYAGKLRQRRKQMEKVPDDPNIGYRQDALLYWVLCERSLALQQLAWEFMLNAEANYAKHPLPAALLDKAKYLCMSYYFDPALSGYYKLYYDNPREKGFKYPYFAFLMLEKDALRYALYRAEYRCNQGHGGFGYWQGDFAETIWVDFNWKSYLGLYFRDDSNELYDLTGSRFNSYHARHYRHDSRAMVKSGWARGFELRSKSHSVYASILISLIKCSEYCRSLNRIYKEKWWDKPDESNIRGYISLSWIPQSFRSPDDKLWDTARFLYLCTDNFLWKIKFAESHGVEDKKIYPCVIREKYGKKSAELHFYRDALASDLKSCRQKINDADGLEDPELQEAARKVCANTEAILKIWDSYCAGNITYASFVQTVQNQEKSYYNWRYKAITARWNYLLKRNKNALLYTKQNLSLDGVPYFLIDPLVSKALEKKD